MWLQKNSETQNNDYFSVLNLFLNNLIYKNDTIILKVSILLLSIELSYILLLRI